MKVREWLSDEQEDFFFEKQILGLAQTGHPGVNSQGFTKLPATFV